MELKEMMGQINTNLEGMKTEVKESMNKIGARVDELELKMKRPVFGGTEKKSNYFEGQRVARLWKCEILAQKENKSINEIANQIYGKKDIDFVEEIKALTAGGDNGNLIEEQYYNEIIPMLYDQTFLKEVGANFVPMSKGNLSIRKMVSGTTAKYVGERKGVLPSDPRFAKIKLSAKKLQVKSVISNDLLRDNTPQADRLVRDDMLMQLAIAMNYVALYGDGTEYTPIGIVNTPNVNKVAKQAANGDKLYALMVAPIKKNKITMVKPYWIVSTDVWTDLYNETFPNGNYKYRDELKQGKLHGYPCFECTLSKDGDVVFGDWSKFFVGEQIALELKTSEEATYKDENGDLQSAFDNDETIIKGMMTHDMGAVYGQAFSYGNFTTTTGAKMTKASK